MSLDVVIFRPSWQVMRVSCLVENNPYGGMQNPTGSEDSINRLNNYINAVWTDDATVSTENTRMNLTQQEEFACRVYRVSGFLAATINGLRGQHLPHLEQVQKYADQLHPLLDPHSVQQVANKWDWDVVRFELEDLWIKERSWFMAVLTDMEERIKEKGNKSVELFYFHRLLLEVNS